MVRSKLDPDVEYATRRDLEDEDKDFDAWTYEIDIDGATRMVAVGQPRDSFADLGIIYYPIYLVVDGEVEKQIGVYEIRDELVPHVLDEEGMAQPELMGEPLLYPEDAESGVESSETKRDDTRIRSTYRPRRGASWIERFMRNSGYRLVDNEAGGDCLFAAIRQGLESVGIVKTVADLRKILADEATQSLYEGYETQYAAAKAQYDSATAAVKTLTKESRTLKARMRGSTRESQFALVEKGEAVIDKLREEKEEREQASELLEEFAFMKGINSLQALKAVLQTTAYWGDTWAVSTLERVLNVKLVIFSKDAFVDHDEGNVLQCGQNNDADPDIFAPEYYLLLSLGGDGTAGSMHYELIAYHDRRAFTYAQLPYRVRHLILSKCLERAAGPYYLIPEFRAALSQDAAREVDADVPPVGSTVLQMYGRSSDRPRPGYGAGESGGGEGFAALRAIKGWRRLLADDAPAARDVRKTGCDACLELDGRKWATVRHYVLAQRYMDAHPEFASQFAYTGGKDNRLGQDVEMAERVAGTSAQKRGDPERPPGATADTSRDDIAAKRARDVKFRDGTKARAALLATGTATIRRYTQGAPPVLASDLMDLRARIASETGTKT